MSSHYADVMKILDPNPASKRDKVYLREQALAILKVFGEEPPPAVPARTISFYGASDDLYEVGGSVGDEPDEGGAGERPTYFRVTCNGSLDGLFVSVAFHGCWCVGIAPLDEDVPLPSWPMRWSARGYTTVLEIDVPENTFIELEKKP